MSVSAVNYYYYYYYYYYYCYYYYCYYNYYYYYYFCRGKGIKKESINLKVLSTQVIFFKGNGKKFTVSSIQIKYYPSTVKAITQRRASISALTVQCPLGNILRFCNTLEFTATTFVQTARFSTEMIFAMFSIFLPRIPYFLHEQYTRQKHIFLILMIFSRKCFSWLDTIDWLITNITLLLTTINSIKKDFFVVTHYVSLCFALRL